MQAVVLTKRGIGGVAVQEIAAPVRSPGFARVRMLAASVNRVDLYMRDSGAGITHSLPQVMGVDGVGEIVEIDDGSAFRPGQRVLIYPYEFCGRCRHCAAGNQPLCTGACILGEHRDGTFAEQVVVPEQSLMALSPTADTHGAAALGVAYLTAWRMVFGKAAPGPGSVVLVVGAGGGVALAAVQLARLAGARVIASSTGAAKLAELARLGAEPIDYRAEDVVKRVMALTEGEGADLVIDNVGEQTWPASLRATARGGHLVTCGATTGAHPSAELQRLFVRQLSIHGSTMGSLDEFRRMVRSFEARDFVPCIDSVFPLDRITDAFARLEQPDRLGKVIINIAPASAASQESLQ